MPNIYTYSGPSDAQIVEYFKLVAQRNPAPRTLTNEDIQYGMDYACGWSGKDAFDDMIIALKATPADSEPLWLRDGEVFLRTYSRTPIRHCRWGWASATKEMCRKPVIHTRLTWGLEKWGGPTDHNYLYNQSFWIESWRHLDGTELHVREDDTYGPDCNACDPIPMCLVCGQEYMDNHCSKCHVNGSLVTEMLAYGNSTTCLTLSCDHKSYYSIGD